MPGLSQALRLGKSLGLPAAIGAPTQGGGVDTDPDAFPFTAAMAAGGSTVESNEVTIAGINKDADLTITGGEYSINGGAWSSAARKVALGDLVKVRGVASSVVSKLTRVTLTIGTVVSTFIIATIGDALTNLVTTDLDERITFERTTASWDAAAAEYGPNISVRGTNGLAVFEPRRQYATAPGDPQTQTIALAAGSYIVTCGGAGSVAVSGGATGTATASAPLSFTLASAGSITLTPTNIAWMNVQNGAYQTPPIFAPSAIFDRGADVAYTRFAPFDALVNVSEWTVAFEFIPTVSSGERNIWNLTDGTSANRMNLRINGGAISFVALKANAAMVTLATKPFTLNARNRVVVTYKAGRFAMSVNGAAVDAATAGVSLPTLDRFFIGQRQSSNYLNGYVSAVEIRRTAMTDTEMVAWSAAVPAAADNPWVAPADPAPGYNGSLLTWAPPTLVTPTTLDLRNVTDTAASYTFASTEDVNVLLPTNRYLDTYSLQIIGGRYVNMIGGGLRAKQALKYEAGKAYNAGDVVVSGTSLYKANSAGVAGGTPPTGTGSSITDGGITWSYFRSHGRGLLRITSPSKAAFVEGVDFDVNNAWGYDGFEPSGPAQPNLYLQNCRVTGLNGDVNGLHPDALQFYGAIGKVRVDKLTVRSQYQGLFLPPQYPITSIDLRRVDLGFSDPTQNAGYLLWLFDNATQTRQPVSLDQIYVQDRQTAPIGQPESYVVWPASPQSGSIGAQRSGSTITWPNIAEITGSVTVGLPGTDMVPAGVAGPGYSSPGYRP